MDVFSLLIVACFLGAGVGFTVYGLRLLRRGEEVTAEDAVTWRRSVKKLGFDASPDMNPDITDILVRAWRAVRGWGSLCVGICVVLACAITAIFWVVGVHRLDILVVFLWWLGGLVYLASLAGGIVGLSRIPRESHRTGDMFTSRFLPMLSRRLKIMSWYPAVVLISNATFMALLVLLLFLRLPGASLARVFALTGMWSAPVVLALLTVIVTSRIFVKRWVLALPPLRLPQDAEVRQRADGELRQLTIEQTYSTAVYSAGTIAFVQFIFLISVPYSGPLVIAGLDVWVIAYFIVIQFGSIIAQMSSQFNVLGLAIPRRSVV